VKRTESVESSLDELLSLKGRSNDGDGLSSRCRVRCKQSQGLHRRKERRREKEKRTLLDLTDDLLCVLLVHIVHDHVRSTLREDESVGTPETRAGTGDEDGLVVETNGGGGLRVRREGFGFLEVPL
jgi:hypothetical protein